MIRYRRYWYDPVPENLALEKKIVLMILNQPLATQIKYFNILWEKVFYDWLVYYIVSCDWLVYYIVFYDWLVYYIVSCDWLAYYIVFCDWLAYYIVFYFIFTALYKVIVDGATNELYTCTSGNLDFIPDLITGDFDSAKPELLNFYKEKVDYFVVLGAFGGRLDHIFSNINTLYEVQDQTTAPILLFGEGSLATLLLEGDYRLHVDTGLESEWCGLIPVSEPCSNVTTTGLKWNLEGQRLQFGSIISTSNTYDKTGVVTITTDKPLLWTMGVKSL
ncbi:hypothetical protein KUTeg_015378 [Tegillarca granosa]|uniref:Thiamin pyrophosphokinase thiamin-binding domain-containing protein n=1 Tax=Tegillarca granosa TaxID=220873 RepID=A0ABQ9EPZ7_TEGGR|nr:hypothetical protein KUTeg_015378 [Tegillarca granosa]